MRLFALSAILLVIASGAHAQPPQPPVDYAAASSWLCRPGAETLCTTGLDALAVTGDGTRTPQPFVPAADPSIDCFYVYPTVSKDPATYADLAVSPEIVETLKGQFARLGSRCRLYAPIYRQLTWQGVQQALRGGGALPTDGPYRDVRDAFHWYMANANHGRGVVLVGHSQGAILLQRLIAQEIDGKPAQKQFVSAFLAGDPVLAVPTGGRVGGAFKSTPLCGSASEVGCVYVWADYLSDDEAGSRFFGENPGGGMVAGCVNPAAPGGGPGPLKTYLRRPASAPPGDPPWIEVLGQLSGQCVADKAGDVLRVTVLPSPLHDRLELGLMQYGLGPGWGLHRLDLSLPQGNILDVLRKEGFTWQAKFGWTSYCPNSCNKDTITLTDIPPDGPRFRDFPASDPMLGASKPPILAGAQTRMFRTVVREGAVKGPNFAGHYTLIEFGCGSDCSEWAIADAATGKIYWPKELGTTQRTNIDPLVDPDNIGLVRYDLHSRLLMVIGDIDEDPARRGVSYFVWDHDRLKLIRFVPHST